jgi:glutaconate CoA-transferase subunit A
VSKLVTLKEAVSVVEDGSSLALSGFAITRCAVAAAHEIVRAGKRDLTVIQLTGGLDTDLLAGGGCIRHYLSSGGSLDRFGALYALNRLILAGEVEAPEYSNLAIALRLHAGALGLPFIPTRSMLGSELLESLLKDEEAVRLERDPFGGRPIIAMAPLKPDVAIVHVDRADEDGNAVIGGPTWGLREAACAAQHTVLLAEEIVPRGSLDPNGVTIPGPFVGSVAHVKRACYPTAAVGQYDYDRSHIEMYVTAAIEGGDAYARYLDEYVYGVSSHEEYLERAGVVM